MQSSTRATWWRAARSSRRLRDSMGMEAPVGFWQSGVTRINFTRFWASAASTPSRSIPAATPAAVRIGTPKQRTRGYQQLFGFQPQAFPIELGQEFALQRFIAV